MSDIAVGPWGDTNVRGLGTHWSWTPNGPITRIDIEAQTYKDYVDNYHKIHSIRFKSNNNSSPAYGYNSISPQFKVYFGFDINAPWEYLIGISGAYRQWSSNMYLVKLSFETNLGKYGPWPDTSYTDAIEFSYITPDRSPVIGFHGFHTCAGANPFLNSIGFYVKPPSPAPFILSDIAVGPWGDKNVRGLGTYWSWKPSGPITRIDVEAQTYKDSVDNYYKIHSIKFKSNNNSSPAYGYNSISQEFKVHFSFDIKAPSEYLIGISGAYRQWSSNNYLVKLSFETNLGKYGPWPDTSYIDAIQFSYKTPDGSPVIGFHGFHTCAGANPFLNSIGVFVKPILPRPPPPSTPIILPKSNLEESTIVGPWGGLDGILWKYEPENSIKQIDIGYEPGSRINYITFKNIFDEQSECYGSADGQLTKKEIHVDLPSECLIGIRGTYKFLDYNGKMVIESLNFVTNRKIYGPYGGSNSGYPFQYENKGGNSIVGFFGATDKYINAIGLFVKPTTTLPPPPPPPPPNPIFVNEWGGPDGKSWKFQPSSAFSEIVIFHSKVVHSLTFKTEDGIESETFGGNGGNKSTVYIKPGVRLTGIKGTYGKRGYYILVTSLSFRTSDGDVHGHFGDQFGTEFSFVVDDGSIIGFHGHAGALLNAIGVYMLPVT